MEKNKGKQAVIVTYLAMFLEGGLINVVGALMMMLAIRLARDPGEIALLASVKGFGTFFTLYISGIISDKRGRKGIITLGAILFAVYNIGMMITSSYLVALFFSFISGVAHGLMDAPAIGIIFDAHKEKSGPYVSVIQVFFGGGGVITTFITAYLMDRGLDYHYLFGFYLIISILLIVLTLLIKFPLHGKTDTQNEKPVVQVFENPPSIKREGAFILAFVLFNALAGYTATTWLPLYTQVTKGILESDAVQSLGYYLAGSIVGAMIFSQVLRRYHTTTLLSVNTFFGAIATFLLISSKTILTVYLSSLILGFFMGNFYSLLVGLGGELFPAKSGGFTGLTGTASMIGNIAVTSITGLLVAKIGVAFVFPLSLGILAVTFFLSLILRKLYLNLGKKSYKRIEN